MNRDVLQGKWKQFRGKVKEEWGQIADHDLDKISSTRGPLVSLVQEKYGYTKQKAERDLDHFLKRLHLGPANGNQAFRILAVFAGSLLTLTVFQVLARCQRAEA